jgi:hypothetical protein
MDKKKDMNAIYYIIITILVGTSCSLVQITNVYAVCIANVNCSNDYSSQRGSQIVISRDSSSPSSKINILIHAPDFNSSPYAIDTIGVDGSTVIIHTREGSIPYKLVETGFDTGDFAGYVILSSTTSTCSPICGPTDGFLAASGDDAITVSLIYPDGSTISSPSFNTIPTIHKTIPEFPFANVILLASIISLIFFSKMKLKMN